jgi:hypothetical protein
MNRLFVYAIIGIALSLVFILVVSSVMMVHGEIDSIWLEPHRPGVPEHGIPANVYDEGENITIHCSRFYLSALPPRIASWDDQILIYNSTGGLVGGNYEPVPLSDAPLAWYYSSSCQINWTAPNCTSRMPEMYSIVFRSLTFNFTVKPLNWVY